MTATPGQIVGQAFAKVVGLYAMSDITPIILFFCFYYFTELGIILSILLAYAITFVLIVILMNDFLEIPSMLLGFVYLIPLSLLSKIPIIGKELNEFIYKLLSPVGAPVRKLFDLWV